MIIIIDHDKSRVDAIRRMLKMKFHCAVAQTSEHVKNLLMSNQPVAVIADARLLRSFEDGWENFLLLSQSKAKVILFANHFERQETDIFEQNGISVIDPETEWKRLESLIQPLRRKHTSTAGSHSQHKAISRLRDHVFSNLLEGHDLPQDTAQMMEFLGLTSSTDRYYLSFVISFSAKSPEDLMENVLETALKIQAIAQEEISKIAVNRSCIRTPDRVVFVLLMREPGEPFRYVLESTLEVISKRIDKEYSQKIVVGVGLADMTINGIAMSYSQACDALDQGRFFGSSFVCFYCDLFDFGLQQFICNSQRFQITKSFREQILQFLYHDELEAIDCLLEEQFRQFYTQSLLSKENILALKVDMAVLMMDVADKLAISAGKPQFYSQLINDILYADSLSTLEIIMKQYLREMAHASSQEHDKRAGRIVRNTQGIIMDRIEEPVNVQTLAQIQKISPNYLSAVFKSETGVRLTEYITNVKMQEAARRIRTTEDNISDIAANLGYEGANYFSKLFKKQYGVSPSEYRSLQSERM